MFSAAPTPQVTASILKALELSLIHIFGGVELTPMQQENLKNGKEITIVNEELNKAAKVKLDLNCLLYTSIIYNM